MNAKQICQKIMQLLQSGIIDNAGQTPLPHIDANKVTGIFIFVTLEENKHAAFAIGEFHAGCLIENVIRRMADVYDKNRDIGMM